MPDYAQRLKRLREKMSRAGVDLLLLAARTDFDANVFYYSGNYSFPAFVAVTREEARICSDAEPAADCIEFLELKDFRKQLHSIIRDSKPRKIGVDSASAGAAATVFDLAKRGKKTVSFTKQLLELRSAKDAKELKNIARAQELTKRCVNAALEKNFFGLTENQLAGLLEKTARDHGAPLNAFTPIVLSGEATAIPHAQPSNKKISREDVLLIDVGARVEWYCGDFSTTVYEGRDNEIREAVDAVKEAKREADKRARPGVKGSVLSSAALRVLWERGFEEISFKKTGLSLGHFIGLDVHEGSLEKSVLARGNAFSIEPGVYARGRFGVRFEDLVLLK